MLDAMFSAVVGDDVFEEDPTVIALEKKAASVFGMEAGLFVASGTMGNQVAIRMLTVPQDQIICDQRSHIYWYEGGGVAANSHVSLRMVDGDRGRVTAEQVRSNINPDDVHFPRTAVVSLENTCNKGGGSIYLLSQIRAIAEVCKKNGLKLHLDGARVFNALVETQEDPSEYGKCFDSISVCLSKGLGAPVGSVLLASAEGIRQARRIRKMFGGGMRQAGYLAAAGLFALENHISRLKEDHLNARILAGALRELPFVTEIIPVDTNILIFSIDPAYSDAAGFAKTLEEKGIRGIPVGPQSIRLVTHLDISQDMMDHSLGVFRSPVMPR
jgi:threonine aldolase